MKSFLRGSLSCATGRGRGKTGKKDSPTFIRELSALEGPTSIKTIMKVIAPV